MRDPESWAWMKLLEKVGKVLRSSQEEELPLQLIVEGIAELLGCQTCAILFRDERSESFRIRHHWGLSHTFAKTFARRFEVGVFHKIMWTGEPLVVSDARLNPTLEAETRLERPYHACAILRIHANHSRLGYLHVDFQVPKEFSSDEIEILQLFADLAGVAILKARLHGENLRLNPYDSDTGLLSYGHFLASLERYLHHAKASNEGFAVIIFDIDHYRDLVNVYGGQRAHAVFQKICGEVTKLIGAFDAASRYGLDEIIIYVSNTSPNRARELAEEIRHRISELRFPEIDGGVTISGGIATFPGHGTDLHALIDSAGKALFATQHVRRNAVFSFDVSEKPITVKEIDEENLEIRAH